jgi:hypothetical protein
LLLIRYADSERQASEGQSRDLLDADWKTGFPGGLT